MVEAAGLIDNPVTGDQVPDWIAGNRPSYCSAGCWMANVTGYILVTYQQARGNGQKRSPDLYLEIRAFQ